MQQSCLMLALVLSASSVAWAQGGGAAGMMPGARWPQTAEKTRVETRDRAMALAREFLEDICQEQCMLLGVDVAMEAHQIQEGGLPGFEDVVRVKTHYRPGVITAALAMDADLKGRTRKGILRGLRRKLSSLGAAKVSVETQTFAWPRERSEMPTPFLIELKDGRGQGNQGAQSAEPNLPSTARERLLYAFADAGPWLLGLLLALLGVLAIVSAWRRPREPPVLPWEDAPLPAPLPAPPEPLQLTDGMEVNAPPDATPSVLLEQVQSDSALRLGVMRRALTQRPPEEVARYLRLLGMEALADFHDSHLGSQLGEVYAAVRRTEPLDNGRQEETLANLEQLVLDEIRDGVMGADLSVLSLIDEEAFITVADSLDEWERWHLLLVAPKVWREAYLKRMRPEERLAFFDGGLAVLDDVSAQEKTRLTDKVKRLADAQIHKRQLALRAASSLTSCLDEMDEEQQTEFVDELQARSLHWQKLIEKEVVCERDLMLADDRALEMLLVLSNPAMMVTFVRSAGDELRQRLESKLPRYLMSLYDRDQNSVEDPEQIKRARAHVFGVWRDRVQTTTVGPVLGGL